MFIVTNIVLDLRQPGPGVGFLLYKGWGFYLQLAISQSVVQSDWGTGDFMWLDENDNVNVCSVQCSTLLIVLLAQYNKQMWLCNDVSQLRKPPWRGYVSWTELIKWLSKSPTQVFRLRNNSDVLHTIPHVSLAVKKISKHICSSRGSVLTSWSMQHYYEEESWQ